ncbi:acyl-coenzyme A synthetase ACSM3, mitochondrial-like [Lytechinus variegatus]|uniref:acyl-coenzyme A synthetase ACSM3, mitochondrial-like n=1 Tax=Lytechinus variegatus TaxID=7654 RepID=UPI001BB0F6D5|nr:acyl-coenzyme A synthetase ACSM3, mitochondrial-like [Lytechinus variegatus]XP_041473471.1 acyl-coenzyme A synthetase ACSM3, mitochondrial-like [Lytechinus variegatus]XP_041473472.1 acyl-coenzyme A synthetase ACSM3, mitochondrial-like [Lytechinus variegatus]
MWSQIGFVSRNLQTFRSASRKSKLYNLRIFPSYEGSSPTSILCRDEVRTPMLPTVPQRSSMATCTSPLIFAKHYPSPCISRTVIGKPLWKNIVDTANVIPLPWQLSSRSAVSMTGFNDYELGRREFKIDVPEYFNFASDVMDEWARKEETGERSSNIPAFWWIDTEGNEIKWSFRDLSTKSKKVANLLEKNCNIKQHDRVMVILPRLPEWWLLNLACLRIGAVLVPGSTQLREMDIRDRLESSKAVCIITDEEISRLVDNVEKDTDGFQHKILIGDEDNMNKKDRAGWLHFQELFDAASDHHECVKSRSSDPMTVFFTSGTTAKPKMAEHTHASYGLGHIITAKYWLDLTQHDIFWNMSDTGWAKSAYSNIFAPWTQGSCVFIHHSPRFDPLQTLQVFNDYPISIFCGPPLAYNMMVQQDTTKYNLRSLRDCVSAGEFLSPEVNEAWRQVSGKFIREGYGQTETVAMIASYRCIQTKPGSCGKACPGYDIAIVDEDGNELPRGEVGIVGMKVKPVRPLGLFSQYVDDPERTKSVFRGDYYVTGDKAIQDEDGYFWLMGRNDDVITSAGYRIGPFEVESALIKHPAVAEVAAVSSPDPTRGEVVKTFVVLAEDYKSRDQAELITELQEHSKQLTAPYKYPRKIEFVDLLPKTTSGKIRRVELRQREWGQRPEK